MHFIYIYIYINIYIYAFYIYIYIYIYIVRIFIYYMLNLEDGRVHFCFKSYNFKSFHHNVIMRNSHQEVL